jgi:hypothetical protein
LPDLGNLILCPMRVIPVSLDGQLHFGEAGFQLFSDG